LVLIGLSLDNVCSYAFGDMAHIDFELYDPFDSEGETEEEKEDKKDEKIEVNPFATASEFNLSLTNALLSFRFASNPHPEINTPPPKLG